MIKLSDEEIVKMLQSSNKKRENKALLYLHHQLFPMAIRIIKNFKGSAEDAEDVFQEALLAFFKLARTRKLPEKVNAEAYLITICKNIWFKKFKKKTNNVELSDKFTHLPTEDSQIRETIEDHQTFFQKILQSKLGESCYKLMIFFYYENRKMKEIATLLSLSNEQVAKNKKLACMKKLKRLMEDEPTLKNAFL